MNMDELRKQMMGEAGNQLIKIATENEALKAYNERLKSSNNVLNETIYALTLRCHTLSHGRDCKGCLIVGCQYNIMEERK